MRRLVVAWGAWRCLLLCNLHDLLRPVSGEIGVEPTDKELGLLAYEFGAELTQKWRQCTGEVRTCPVGRLMKDLAVVFEKLRIGFDACMGKKCTFDQSWCNVFWEAIWPRLDGLRGSCGLPDKDGKADWPAACTQLLVSMNDFYNKPEFELRVMCSLVQPGGTKRWGLIHQPQCSHLALSMLEYHDTMSGCSEMGKDQCVAHFCAFNSEFRWRMKPRQLQKTLPGVNISTYFDQDYVLNGCAKAEAVAYSDEDCPLREDVQGICDCLCDGWRKMPKVNPVYQCEKSIESYLMFGRMGVEGLRLEPICEDSLCSLLSASKNKCPGLKLPDMGQCKALQLPHIAMEACPWEQHSGEDGVMVCLDGHRCRPDEDSWSCCFRHKGRGRCPKDKPIMCDELCSGSPTEYCCEEDEPSNPKCKPRPCSPLLVPWEITVPPTTVIFTTTIAPSLRKPQEGGAIEIRLPDGSWVWLLLIVPFFLGLFCVYLYRRAWKAAQWVDVNIEAKKTDAVPDYDRLGPFHIVRRPEASQDLPANRLALVKLVVEDLPQQKPLGLELNECKVARVHAAGLKAGWQIGDKIVQVGSYPVETFEEIWQRVQI